jgi:hypothetical protein
LTLAEFINLTQLLLDERYRLGKISAMRDLVNGNLPEVWEAVLCLNCNKPIRGCIKDAKGLRIIISDDSTLVGVTLPVVADIIFSLSTC